MTKPKPIRFSDLGKIHLNYQPTEQSWHKNVKIPLIFPQEPPNSPKEPTTATFYTYKGYQLVHPYFRPMFFQTSASWAKQTVESALKKYLTIPHYQAQKVLNLPQERSASYWGRMLAAGFVWVSGLRKLDSDTEINGKIFRKGNKALMEASGPEVANWPLRINDSVGNMSCVHELPVPLTDSAQIKIEIIFESKDLLVVNKPAGIPVHPTGNSYRFNTVVSILQRQLDRVDMELWPCHRIDRDTSGVLFLAKNSKTCGKMSTVIADKSNVQKTYIAKVEGKFENNIICTDDIISLDFTKDYKRGGIIQRPQKAETIFKFLEYNTKEDTTTIIAQLKTGRRHQIRQHLRNIGHPVVSDPLYGKGKLLSSPMFNQPTPMHFQQLRERHTELIQEENRHKEPVNVCAECAHVTYIPTIKETPMQLHALEYRALDGSWSFMSSVPQSYNATREKL
ncbi:hypothetical protein DAMA08_006550 [Martiniozyma asiatica (nom. inval.)]|nr:hypothetical protein DAMA08_006550 [Martiniozyma asiatica]